MQRVDEPFELALICHFTQIHQHKDDLTTLNLLEMKNGVLSWVFLHTLLFEQGGKDGLLH